MVMDSAQGNTIWSRNLGVTTHNTTELEIKGMWNVRNVDEGEGALLAVLATRSRGDVSHLYAIRSPQVVTTVPFHIEALTGKVKGDINPTTGLPIGKELFEGGSESAFLVPFENCGTKIRVLAVVDQLKNVSAAAI